MDFVRSRKAQSVPSFPSPSKHPKDKSGTEDPPVQDVSRESGSCNAAVLCQKPQEVEMEGEEEELSAPPPAVTGMIYLNSTPVSALCCW